LTSLWLDLRSERTPNTADHASAGGHGLRARYRDPVAEPKRQRSFSALLAFAGLVLLGLCVVTALRRQDVLAGGLAVLGLGAMVLAALTPRLTGPVEMGLTGFKMELVKLSEVGRLAGYSEEEILAAIEDKLRRDNDGHGEEEHNLRREPPPPQPRPRGRPGGGWSWSDDDDRRWNADNRRLWDQSEDIERRIEFLQPFGRSGPAPIALNAA
jgi:hypothetical protein